MFLIELNRIDSDLPSITLQHTKDKTPSLQCTRDGKSHRIERKCHIQNQDYKEDCNGTEIKVLVKVS